MLACGGGRGEGKKGEGEGVKGSEVLRWMNGMGIEATILPAMPRKSCQRRERDPEGLVLVYSMEVKRIGYWKEQLFGDGDKDIEDSQKIHFLWLFCLAVFWSSLEVHIALSIKARGR